MKTTVKELCEKYPTATFRISSGDDWLPDLYLHLTNSIELECPWCSVPFEIFDLETFVKNLQERNMIDISYGDQIQIRERDKPHCPQSRDELLKLIQANISLEDIETGLITDMSDLFRNSTRKNFQGIANWVTSAVTTMEGMFDGAKNFNEDISKWDTSSVTNMSRMFQDASSFNQDIGHWKTGKVTDMSWMFHGAVAFNQPLRGWDTDKVTDMSHMFQEACAFNQYIGGWRTSSVTRMDSMFMNAIAFNQDISRWNTQKVTSMRAMFKVPGNSARTSAAGTHQTSQT